jgi:hypothetical protein
MMLMQIGTKCYGEGDEESGLGPGDAVSGGWHEVPGEGVPVAASSPDTPALHAALEADT